MACCEKCWGDAWLRSQSNREPQYENYTRLIEERKFSPCSPKESAGQFWDEEKGVDSRRLADKSK
ncbi:unnamed protein product [marine sediment metagenome]|uniref:Uncharacterized protein n=1 Tax=marine sediment metagenome TaxID=412755 RepID=X0YG25_9ZZZZ